MNRHHQERPGGGVPDGLLVGLLALFLGAFALVWSATGLAGLFAHGSWPSGVTFRNTAPAVRSLVSAPQDLPAAWPATPAGELSGYGLFWGLVIGELMLLLVLGVFAVGTLARWKSVRARRRELRHSAPSPVRYEKTAPAAARSARPAEKPTPEPRPAPSARVPVPASAPASPDPDPDPPQAPAPAPAPAPGDATVLPPLPAQRAPRVLFGDPAARRPAVLRAIRDAEGPALVVTSDPTIWDETKDARAKLGPVLVYDPGHLCDTPGRLHWSPAAGCENTETAAARATALLTPVRPRSPLDSAMADTAHTLLRCWLHAAAVDGRPFKQVHRWAHGAGAGAQEAVRILRTHPKATPGFAGLLESAFTAHPDRRETAQRLVALALSSLSSIHIREACTPNRTDALILESFIDEGGTLYLVGEPIEDPKSQPGAMPLLTALASDVVEHGRRMAARSSSGRLDPPMTLVLDDAAAVAPLPHLPELLATGQAQGLPTLAFLRSAEQARARWQTDLPV
jgi:hypothetical protein